MSEFQRLPESVDKGGVHINGGIRIAHYLLAKV